MVDNSKFREKSTPHEGFEGLRALCALVYFTSYVIHVTVLAYDRMFRYVLKSFLEMIFHAYYLKRHAISDVVQNVKEACISLIHIIRNYKCMDHGHTL